jgi:hypothetical protein
MGVQLSKLLGSLETGTDHVHGFHMSYDAVPMSKLVLLKPHQTAAVALAFFVQYLTTFGRKPRSSLNMYFKCDWHKFADYEA